MNVENLIRDALREDLPANCQVTVEGEALIITVSSAKDLEGVSLRRAWEQTIDAVLDTVFTLQRYAFVAFVEYRSGDLSYPRFNPAKYVAAASLYRLLLD